MVDPLSGHTSAGNTDGNDGLRDGDSLSSPTLTNILQGLRGNGIVRLQDGALGSDRNLVNINQPGAVTKVIATPATQLTIQGGYMLLDGQLYEFAGGPGGTSTLTIGQTNPVSHGTGVALASGSQSLYCIYVASQGGADRVYADGGAGAVVADGLYPSLPTQYLADYDAGTNLKNECVVVLATVRCQFHTNGGNHKVDIIEINDKRHFLSNAPMYMFPITSGSLASDSQSKSSQISRGVAEGVQSPADLRGLFGGTEVGDFGTTANSSTNLIDAGAMWMSTSKSGAGSAAEASVTITAFTELNAGDRVNLIATDGTNYNFVVGDQSSVNGTFEATTSNHATATNLMNVINTSSGPSGTRFTATVHASNAVVTVTQVVGGIAGNTTVTLTDSGTAGMTKTDFIGGAGYGFGPGDGLDRGNNQMKDELFFAGQENSETALVSKRLFSKGVSAPSAVISASITYSITSYGDSVFILNPAATKTVTLAPEKSGSNYLFPEGHIIEVVNSASAGGGNITFDPSELDSDIVPAFRATFIFEGSLWLRTAYETSTSAAATTFLTLSDTPTDFDDVAASFDANLKGLRVNAAENAIEFYDIPTAGATLPGIDDQASSLDDQITITDTAVTINVDHDDLDFKVISDDNTATLHVDGAGAGKIGINQVTPEMTLQLDGVGFEYDGGTGTATTNSSNPSTALTIDLFHIQKFRSAKLLVETENTDEEKYEVAEIVVTTPYKSDSTIGSDAEMPTQVYGVLSSDSADNAPGTPVVNTYSVYAESSNSNIQLRVTPAHTGDTVSVRAFWYAIGL